MKTYKFINHNIGLETEPYTLKLLAYDGIAEIADYIIQSPHCILEDNTSRVLMISGRVMSKQCKFILARKSSYLPWIIFNRTRRLERVIDLNKLRDIPL